MVNQVLEAIKKRRNIIRFESNPITDSNIQAILEAGRWAPSWLNKQPWKFILVKNQKLKEKISELVTTIHNLGIKEAPICIAVCVNPKEDPYHFIEDGTAVTQNIALAAYSLKLGTSWIGVFNLEGNKNSAEERIKTILKIPKDWRLISIIPLGVPKFFKEKGRKELSQIISHDNFG